MAASRWRQWLARGGTSLGFGLGLTLLAAVVHLLGLTERLELIVYDWYVEHFSRIPPSDRIVHIDIDDDSLERVGSWPWSRAIQADLVLILRELGAEQIVLDLMFPEPKGREVDIPGLDAYADVEGSVAQMGRLSEENFIFPDDELAGAFHQAGNVYLSFHYETDESRKKIRQLAPELSARMADLLRREFDLDRDRIAGRLQVKPAEVDALLAGVKRRVALERVRAELRDRPDASAEQVHRALSTRPFEKESADRADVIFAYLREKGIRELWSRSEPVPPGLKGRLPTAREVVPPLYKFTQGARRCGFVAFEPDFDGRTRRVPLLMEWNGALIEQLGFAAVRDVLGIRVEDLSLAANGDLLIAARGSRPAMRVPLDERGQMLINWSVHHEKWEQCFRHVPVTQLLRIHDCRRRIRQNEIGRQILLGELVRIVGGEDGFQLYARQVNELLARQRAKRQARRLASRPDDPALAEAEAAMAGLRAQIETTQKDMIDLAREEWRTLSAASRPAEEDLAAEYDRFKRAVELLDGDVAAYQRANAGIAALERELIEQLRPLIAGKLCFVGYTATAVADMVTTPAYPRMPGVLVHSSVMNGFLQGQFRDWSPRYVQVLVILALGGLASLLAATRGPRESLVLLAGLVVFLILINGSVVFQRLDHWLELVSALIALLAAWAAIVVVRYLTVERARRRFSRAVAQYVSPAMARQISESAEEFDLSPVSGHVTCFFSDLAGFTRLSERLGPDGTRTVLNPYLEAMSAVLHRHNALINKFIGDGIFAFFNPPILPCEGHELAACAAAIESQRALLELKAGHDHDPLADEFRRLAMRIGIGSGPVFVGDYGSENKLDYTCMGDTVNLASRLEGANKVFGTTIMVNGAARDSAGDEFVFRPLGALQVKGQTVAVRVYELLGYKGKINGRVLAFSERFEEAVQAFARRDWLAARRLFEACAELKPDDPGAAFYLATIRRYLESPPGEDWNGGVELTEK